MRLAARSLVPASNRRSAMFSCASARYAVYRSIWRVACAGSSSQPPARIASAPIVPVAPRRPWGDQRSRVCSSVIWFLRAS